MFNHKPKQTLSNHRDIYVFVTLILLAIHFMSVLVIKLASSGSIVSKGAAYVLIAVCVIAMYIGHIVKSRWGYFDWK